MLKSLFHLGSPQVSRDTCTQWPKFENGTTMPDTDEAKDVLDHKRVKILLFFLFPACFSPVRHWSLRLFLCLALQRRDHDHHRVAHQLPGIGLS